MGTQLAKLRRFTRTPASSLKNLDKVLEKKSISPRHPSTVKAIEEMTKANPQFEIAAKEKHENLHAMLDSVRVGSTGAAPDQVLRTGTRGRKVNHILSGKLTSQQLDELYVNRKMDPDTWDENKIGEHYNLDQNVAKNLLMYYSSFRIYKDDASKIHELSTEEQLDRIQGEDKKREAIEELKKNR